MNKVWLIIDGDNVTYSLRTSRLDIDGLEEVVGRAFIPVEKHYFLAIRAVMEEEAFDKQLSFTRMLIGKGYRVHEQRMHRLRSSETWKGDCDIPIALCAADAAASTVEWVVLVSNDSDFTAVVEYLHHRGKKIAIVSVDGMASMDLRNIADVYIDLSEEEGAFMKRGEGGGR